MDFDEALMKRTKWVSTFSILVLALGGSVATAADEDPAPPPGQPTREELRARVKNLTPEKREATIREFRERRGLAATNRPAFDERRKNFEKLRQEMKDLPPEERQARLQEFREQGGVNRTEFNGLSPEQRNAKRRELLERVEREVADLKSEKARGKFSEDDERRLQRMEMIARRLEQGPVGAEVLPPPRSRQDNPSPKPPPPSDGK